jgi:hypothetical protein
MNTLLVWNNGRQLSFYQLPNTIANAYFSVQGVCIGDKHADDQTSRTIEHLAMMIGEEPIVGDTMPPLEEWLKGERPLKRERVQRRAKIVEAPWRSFAVQANLEINNCERILHTGWMDLKTSEEEAIGHQVNKELAKAPAGGGGGGGGGDGRGEVTDPAHDGRLKGNRGRTHTDPSNAPSKRKRK